MENNNKNIFNMLSIYFTFYILINFICVLIWPSKSAAYLHCPLGVGNQNLGFFMIGLLCTTLNILINKKAKIVPYVIYLIAIASSIIYKISTAILVFVVLGILLFILDITKTKIINAVSLECISISSIITIVFLRLQNLFEFIITGIFHKDLTFSGRTPIWDKFMNEIEKKPVFGYGFRNNILPVYYENTKKTSIFYAHNMTIDQLYCGGVVLIAYHLFLWIWSAYQLIKKCKNSYISRIIACFFFALTLGNLMEIYDYFYLFFVYMICFEAKNIVPTGTVD